MATPCCSFELHSSFGPARVGTLHLTHGAIRTPAFMPVGTSATVKGMTAQELEGLGADIVLSNTYHLWIRPGHDVIRDMGGLHAFMGWKRPILTDSGGYQVFSLREHLKVTEEGVSFKSPHDGLTRHLTPELAIEIQEAMGVDIAMAFDECLEHPADRERTMRSTERTTRWLERCLAARAHADRTALFGIVQGGMHEDLRAAHAKTLAAMPLDGVAIGGLSVGEGQEIMLRMVEAAVPELPVDKPRYLMGVGHPSDIVEAALRGVDMFDCVLPSRAGRHGQVYTSGGRVNLRNARFARDERRLDPDWPEPGPTAGLSRAYLRHLVRCEELLGKRLCTWHNLWFYQQIMQRLREAIAAQDAAAIEDVRRIAACASRPPGEATLS